MPTVNAKLVKGWPCCPRCGYHYAGAWNNYGTDDNGYWYTFECPKCSKRNKKGTVTTRYFVKYYSDIDFNVIQRRVSS